MLMTGQKAIPLKVEDLRQFTALFHKPLSEVDLMEKLDAIAQHRTLHPPDESLLLEFTPPAAQLHQASASLHDVLTDILKQIERVTGAGFLAYFEVSLATKNVTVVAKRGPYAAGWHESHARGLFRSPVRDVAESGRPCLICRDDEQSWNSLGQLRDLTAFSSCVGVCVPGGHAQRYALFLMDASPEVPSKEVRDQLLLYASFTRAAIDAYRVEQSLERAAKTLQIGQLADQLLHELTNEFQALGRRAALAEEDARKGALPDVLRNLATVRQIIQHTEGIAHTFLVGARSHSGITSADVGDCVARVGKTMALLLGESIAVRTTIGCALLKAAMRPDALYHVLTNMVLNAAQQIEFHHITHGEVAIKARQEAGTPRPLKIRVQDNGPGIHGSLFEAIFERSFTTRPDGAGLGLHICRQLVQAVGGRIQVEQSTIFCGSTFLIELPACLTAG